MKFLSVNNIVIAPANTGNDNINSTAVINTAHTNNGSLCIVIPGALIFTIVVIKFIAPNIDDIPAKCRLNIPKSTAPPEWNSILAIGGYTVHPVPTPPSTKLDVTSNVNAGGNNQKLILFNLGNAISGAPINNGTIQLPNPPIIAGITIKNIIINACAVTITLYNCPFPAKNVCPGNDNSILIITLNAVPTIPLNAPNIIYSVPMSLWFVLYNHLAAQFIYCLLPSFSSLSPFLFYYCRCRYS